MKTNISQNLIAWLIILFSCICIRANSNSIESLVKKGDYHLALKFLKAEKNQSSNQLIENYLLRIECHKALEQWSEVSMILKLIDKIETNATQLVKKTIHYSHYYYSVRDLIQSLNQASSALSMSKDLNDPLLIATSYASVGYFYHLQRIDLIGRIYFDSALVSINRMTNPDPYTLAWIYHCYGNSFNNTTIPSNQFADYGIALNYYNKDLEIYEQLANRTKIAQTIYTKAWLTHKIENRTLEMKLFYEGLRVLLPDLKSNTYKDAPTVLPSFNENLYFLFVNQMAAALSWYAIRTNALDELKIAYRYHLLRIKLYLYLKGKYSSENADLPFYSSYDYLSTDQFADCAERIYQITKDTDILRESFYYASKSKYAYLANEDNLSKKETDAHADSEYLIIRSEFTYHETKVDLSFYQSLQANKSLVIDYYLPVVYRIDSMGLSIARVDYTGNLKLEIDSLYSAMSNGNIKSFAKYSNEIYNNILKPAIGDGTVKELIIIPNIMTKAVPFAALIETLDSEMDFRKLNYLTKRFDVSILLSPHMHRTKSQMNYKALFVSPEFEQDGVFSHLPFTTELSSELSDEFDGTLLSGLDADKRQVLNQIESSTLVHISSHSYFDPKNQDSSFVALFGSSENRTNSLYYKEISQLNLKSDLVVLNGCNTGSGKTIRSEGVMSLGRAFLKAGAGSVITTLWEVDDLASARLLKGFYKGISEGKLKSVALKEAQNDFVEASQSSDDANPYYWAGFILIGDTESITVMRSPQLILMFIGIATFSLFGFILVFRILQSKSSSN